MIQEFACDCLNVTLTDSAESVSQQEVNLVRQLIESTTDLKRNELAQFFANSRLIKLKSGKESGFTIRHNFLCLKQNFPNWKINYCTICEKETHAILVNPDHNKTLSHDQLALVCLNDADQIKVLKSKAAYSPAFGIVLPSNLAFKPLPDRSSESDDVDYLNRGEWNFLSEVQFHTSEEAQQFLSLERQKVDERIKKFAQEENRRFEELRQTVLDEQSHFIQMVKAIKQQHDLVNDSSDKENNSLEKSISEKSGLVAEGTKSIISADYIRKQAFDSEERISGDRQSSSKIRSSDFDGLFDMDDIDVEANGRTTLEEATPFEEDEAEEQDVFPLKETNQYSKEGHQFARSIASDSRDEILPLSRAGMSTISSESTSRRKLSSSVVQNIPHPYQSKNRYHHQTPNSLPIKIPHFRSRMSDLDNDEGYDFKSGESIADRMMKIARSERNENEIDDRPRRRLNTGDIIKARRILN